MKMYNVQPIYMFSVYSVSITLLDEISNFDKNINFEKNDEIELEEILTKFRRANSERCKDNGRFDRS